MTFGHYCQTCGSPIEQVVFRGTGGQRSTAWFHVVPGAGHTARLA